MTHPDLFAQVTQFTVSYAGLGHSGQSQASTTLSQNNSYALSAGERNYKAHLNVWRELTKMWRM